MSFLDILTVHEAMNAAFLAHQVAVLDRDFAQAQNLLVAYRSRLLAHMQDEEEALLPIYERGPIPPNGKIEFFLHEHRQMLRFLDEIRERLAAATVATGDDIPRRMLHLLDKATQYRSFVEHHELREERWLFPALDRLATAEERAALLVRCLRRPEAG